MNPQDEIKARLEVAQLYEEMGQGPKAARYYLAAAEIALKAKLFDQGKGFLEKVLVLEPDNKEARNYLDRLMAHLQSHGMAGGGGSSKPPEAENKPSSAGLSVPTPSVYLRKDQIAAILSQVASAPNPKFFPFSPLPKVDVKAIEAKARATEALREEQRMKERTSVESAFNRGPSNFGSGGSSFLGGATRGSGRARDKDKSQEAAAEAEKPRGSGRRQGNQNLADSILKRIKDR